MTSQISGPELLKAFIGGGTSKKLQHRCLQANRGVSRCHMKCGYDPIYS